MTGPAEASSADWFELFAEVTALRRVRDDVRRLFEVYDRPCEPSGLWRHVDEYASIETRLREAVGAGPRKESE
jgi:hypothetical protein